MNQVRPKLLGVLPFKANELALIGAILLVVCLTALIDSNHSYLDDPWTSLRNIARQTALLGIFSLGAAVVIISGGIDLSSGSVIAFSGTICATIMVLLAPEQMKYQESVGMTVIVCAIAGTMVIGF